MSRAPHPAPRVMVVSILLTLLAFPVSQFVNSNVFKAVSVRPIQSLQVFDLMGIDKSLGGAPNVTKYGVSAADVERCYTPYWSDTMHSWGICGGERRKFGLIGKSEARIPAPPEALDRLSQSWRSAVLANPGEYLLHRLKHFNSSLYFMVPAKPLRYSKARERESDSAEGARDAMDSSRRATSSKVLLLDYVKRPFFFWPVTWMAMGLGLLVIRNKVDPTVFDYPALILATSGLMYGGAYLVVGLATELRYYYWSIMAILLATILSFPRIQYVWRSPTLSSRISFGLVIGVVALGYAFRVFDISWLYD